MADLLNRSLSIDVPLPSVSVSSGEEYEVIGVSSASVLLPPRPPCPRGALIEIINKFLQ